MIDRKALWVYVMGDTIDTSLDVIGIASRMSPDAIAMMENAALRVEVNPDGTFSIVDFTLPSSSGRLRKNIPQEDVPKEFIEKMAMLQIAEAGSYVKGVGFRVSDSLYYVHENWEEKC